VSARAGQRLEGDHRLVVPIRARQQLGPGELGVRPQLRRGEPAEELVAGSCANILEHRAALWTFVDAGCVEPTNNHAERELRAFVLWRKRCFGTQSERGNLFAERLMTVAHTARKQRKDVLAFLTACCQAQLDGIRAPSLFAAA